MNFSICLISRNEATSLPKLVFSLKEFQRRGGEIIVVDTGSLDNTANVARSLGCKVTEVGEKFIFRINDKLAYDINEHFIDGDEKDIVKKGDTLFSYADARNYAASLATNNMVAFADCDEMYTVFNLNAIEEAINGGAEQLEYNFVFSHQSDGSPAIQFRQSKFYDRRKCSWQGIVHEVLEGAAKILYLPENVIKLEHFQAPQPHRSRYLAGLALDCLRHPNKDRQSHYLGRELLWTDHPRSAIKELTRHINMDKWLAEKCQSMIYVGDAYIAIGDEPKALEYYHLAFDTDSSRRESLLRLAQHFYKKNDSQKTASYAAAALEVPWSDFYANHTSHYTFEPHELLYWATWWLGDREKSKYHFDKAVSYFPTNPKYIHDRQFYHPEELEYKEQGIDGWMSLAELNWLYTQAKKSSSILEIGSWEGRSSHALLSGCPGTVTCVDTFKGSADPRDLTNSLGKTIDVFEKFKEHVGHFKNLEILKMSSREASTICKDRKFDFIFIDAGHTYEEVKEDIELWRDKATVILSGHDYSYPWLGVQQAVDEMCGKVSLCESIWSTPVVTMCAYCGKEKAVAMAAKPICNVCSYKNIHLIPKRIFSVWLSENADLPPVIDKCIASQQAVEGYEHYLVTLDNCPRGIPYLDAAIAAKKWVKAADYLRISELIEKGGIYCDADMEILPGKNFDDMLTYSLFVAKEENCFIANSLIGAAANHPLLKAHLAEVVEKFKGDDNKMFEASMEILTPRVYAADGVDGVHVFDPEYFLPYNHQTGIINVTKNTRSFHHFMKSWINTTDLLPIVSILIPTLGREEGLKKCLDSIDKLYYPKHLIDVLIAEGEGTVPVKTNKLMKWARGDVFVYAANDMEFTPYSLYRAIKASEGHGLVAFNSGLVLPDEGNICEHFIIWKDTVDKIGGKIFSEKFHHVGCDNLLWAQCKRIGEASRCEEAKIIHNHFSVGRTMDSIYQKGWSKVGEDRAILAEELNNLEMKIPSLCH